MSPKSMKRPAAACVKKGSQGKKAKGQEVEACEAVSAAETEDVTAEAAGQEEPKEVPEVSENKGKGQGEPQPAKTEVAKAEEEPANDLASQLSKSESLNDKLALIRGDETLTPKEKLAILNKSLTDGDWNKLNGRFKTAKANNSELFEMSSGVAKRSQPRSLVGSFALDPTMGEVWQGLTHHVQSNHRTKKSEEWVSWTKLLQEWSAEERVCQGVPRYSQCLGVQGHQQSVCGEVLG